MNAPAPTLDADTMRPVIRVPACMGGWCTVRDRCAMHCCADRSEVAERLCMPGTRNERPITIARDTRDEVTA